MLASSPPRHNFSSGSKSEEILRTGVSPVPRSPVFEPLYDSDDDEETGISVVPALGRAQQEHRQIRSSSFGSLDTRSRSSTPPPEMSGTSLRSRGKTPQGVDASDSTIPPSHSTKRTSDQDHAKETEVKDTNSSFTQEPAFRLFVLSFTAAWLGAVFMYFFAFATHTLELNGGEQHLLTANSLFASSIELSPLLTDTESRNGGGDPFSTTVFLFLMNIPKHSAAHKERLGQKDLALAGHDTKIWSVWLNRGSHVQVDFLAPQSGLKFAIIKGNRDLPQWRTRPVGSTLQGKGGTSFICQEGAMYHFAFYNPHSSEALVDLSLAIIGAQFDTKNAAAECQLSFEKGKPCVVILPFGVPVFVIVATSEQNDGKTASMPGEPRVVRISYSPKVLSYLVLLVWPFGVSFLAFLLSIMHQGKQQKGIPIFLAANVISATPHGHSSMENVSEGGSDSTGHFKASIAAKPSPQHQVRLAEKAPLLGSSPHKAK